MKRVRKRKRGDVEENSDRISQLPESIIHRILSYLHSKDATRTCVLSKAWSSMFSTFPILDFHLHYRVFCAARRLATERKQDQKSFAKFVNDSIASRLLHNFNVSKFRLCVYYIDTKMFAPHLDYWLNIIKHRSVEELDLSLYHSLHYSVPRTIFLAESLTVLRLGFGCRLEVKNLAGMKLGKLRELYLSQIELDREGELMESFFSGCPLMEHFELRRCNNLRSLCIPSILLELRKVVLDRNNRLGHVEVQAPNLHAFECGGLEYDEEIELVMDACKALKELSLRNIAFEDEQFQDLISSIPGIEVIKLDDIEGLTTMNFSNLYKLKTLVLENCDDLSSIVLKN